MSSGKREIQPDRISFRAAPGLHHRNAARIVLQRREPCRRCHKQLPGPKSTADRIAPPAHPREIQAGGLKGEPLGCFISPHSQFPLVRGGKVNRPSTPRFVTAKVDSDAIVEIADGCKAPICWIVAAPQAHPDKIVRIAPISSTIVAAGLGATPDVSKHPKIPTD